MSNFKKQLSQTSLSTTSRDEETTTTEDDTTATDDDTYSTDDEAYEEEIQEYVDMLEEAISIFFDNLDDGLSVHDALETDMALRASIAVSYLLANCIELVEDYIDEGIYSVEEI